VNPDRSVILEEKVHKELKVVKALKDMLGSQDYQEVLDLKVLVVLKACLVFH